jgi:hypothetical protein
MIIHKIDNLRTARGTRDKRMMRWHLNKDKNHNLMTKNDNFTKQRQQGSQKQTKVEGYIYTSTPSVEGVSE